MEDSWGQMNFARLKDKTFPQLTHLMNGLNKTLEGDPRKKALFDRVENSDKRFYLEVQCPQLKYELWNPVQDFYRMPLSAKYAL